MNSKEALIKFCFKNLQSDDDGFYLLLDEEDAELLRVIQKDLEVLEILKKHSYNDGWSNGFGFKSWEMTEKELTKIREWLEK